MGVMLYLYHFRPEFGGKGPNACQHEKDPMSNDFNHPCERCGTCCEKGGPSLHCEDRSLVDEGLIPARNLFTIRRGEMARDNVKGALVPLSEEIIKIKGQASRWTCCFYDRAARGCGIYHQRPLECRVLNCRDTRRIEAIYETSRLTRQDLLLRVEGLWELIEDHERRCSYKRLREHLAAGCDGQRLHQEQAIVEMLRFDTHLRQLTVEKGALDARMLDFVFGRPLVDTIRTVGIKRVSKNGVDALVRTSAGDIDTNVP